MAVADHACAGYPEGVGCWVRVPLDTIFCRDCRLRRQKELAEGIRDMPLASIGELLDEFVDAMHPLCKCGGDLNGPQHLVSLLHRRWEWLQQHGMASST